MKSHILQCKRRTRRSSRDNQTVESLRSESGKKWARLLEITLLWSKGMNDVCTYTLFIVYTHYSSVLSTKRCNGTEHRRWTNWRDIKYFTKMQETYRNAYSEVYFQDQPEQKKEKKHESKLSRLRILRKIQVYRYEPNAFCLLVKVRYSFYRKQELRNSRSLNRGGYEVSRNNRFISTRARTISQTISPTIQETKSKRINQRFPLATI